MLNIDEKQLKLLLERKKKFIERPKLSGLGEIISGISLIITLLLSDYSQLKIVDPLYFEIFSWLISISILLYGIIELIKSVTNIYSIQQLYNDIGECTEPRKEHHFSIVVIRNSETGKYLVVKNKRWRCWLFPNYRHNEDNFNENSETANVKNNIKRDLDILGKFTCKYNGNEISEKFSVGDKVNKKYRFYYFEIKSTSFNNIKKRVFYYKGKRYCWKTLDQLYSNKNIVKKNGDVLDYIRNHFDVS